ncbi:4Fe-4S dicluster domain-containing protein [Paracoccus sp. YIM 132242]|uniref:4Fe-4S dicluster domain-containing protein n=1 Tax=Paracoccus lichenicola TaxID=2665644 RepID=A0A6L6HPX1_9RHOB|nr:4Fe-4S dicluster domain-containing protein [Paracoccus lichenicola]
MAHVVTQHCCNDAACVDVCPVNCIHPGPTEAAYSTAEMLYIDPDVCIDCGACADACPVGAIVADYDLEPKDHAFIAINAAHFQQPGKRDYHPKRALRQFDDRVALAGSPLRVAIVGTGPAGCYAAEDLLKRTGQGLQIDMFERLFVPWGLARFGVAPDHLNTKEITRSFERTLDDARVTLRLGVEIDRDLSHVDLCAAYDAVIYANGALSDRRLGIEGEALPGSHSAMEFAAWYNGHPDFADLRFDLDTDRAVIIGNGNVALDVARILARDVADLRQSDMAQHALEALTQSRLREIVVLGRRGPLEAAFTLPELMGLRSTAGIALWTDLPADFEADKLQRQAMGAAPWAVRQKVKAILDLPREASSEGRSVRLSFFRAPVAMMGKLRVEGVNLAVTGLTRGPDGKPVTAAIGEQMYQEAGLILRSVGYRGKPIAGVPFEASQGRIPNTAGRVRDPETDENLPGVYVTGWIKRGPSGVMGTNKLCARETVSSVLEDFTAGRLGHITEARERLLTSLPAGGDLAAWRAIDRHERASGLAVGRPRVKLVHQEDMLRAARHQQESYDA